MKRFLPVLFLIACLVISCKSFDNGILLRKETFHHDVKPLRVIVNTASIQRCLNPNSDRNYDLSDHVNVIKNNLSYETEPGDYHLSIIVRKAEFGRGMLGMIFNVFTLSITAPFGMPYFSATCKVELEAAIMSPAGRVLKTYTAKGQDTEYVAAWWGYNPPDDTKTARLLALTNACKELRTQMKNDASTINRLVR
jgi:hypothetical protein